MQARLTAATDLELINHTGSTRALPLCCVPTVWGSRLDFGKVVYMAEDRVEKLQSRLVALSGNIKEVLLFTSLAAMSCLFAYFIPEYPIFPLVDVRDHCKNRLFKVLLLLCCVCDVCVWCVLVCFRTSRRFV